MANPSAQYMRHGCIPQCMCVTKGDVGVLREDVEVLMHIRININKWQPKLSGGGTDTGEACPKGLPSLGFPVAVRPNIVEEEMGHPKVAGVVLIEEALLQRSK